MSEDLLKQMKFIEEIEKLKIIYRQNSVINQSRQENSAEHSWHVAFMAVVLKEYAGKDVNLLRVIKMLLLHDVVEIDAGDTWLYDSQASVGQIDRETKAANRLFGLLPEEQKGEYLDLWTEFTARETPDAAFAAAIDSIQPLINHHLTGSTRNVMIKASQIAEKKRHINNASPLLWEYAQKIIRESAEKGQYS